MRLAIEFKSYDVMNVLWKYFLSLSHITVSEDCNSLAMAIVDHCHEIKAQFQFKLQDMSSVSKNVSNPWELLKTPKSLEVSIECVFII